MKYDYRNISRKDIEESIENYVHNKRDRQIMHDRIIDGIIFDKLAEMHDLSVQQVKNIVNKWQDIVYTHIKENEKC